MGMVSASVFMLTRVTTGCTDRVTSSVEQNAVWNGIM